MFISVDFPAPFSPRSACTSPRRRSKSTWSFATIPGKRLVMPRSSRTGASAAAMRGDSMAPRTRGGREPPRPRDELDRGRDVLDLPGRDLLLDLLDLVDECLRDLRVDLADPDAAGPDAERRVGAALERALHDLVDRGVDGHV